MGPTVEDYNLMEPSTLRKMTTFARTAGSLRADLKWRLHLAGAFLLSIPVQTETFALIIMISLPFPALEVLALWL